MSAERRHRSEERWLTIVATPLVNLPQRHSVVDIIDTFLSRFVLLVSTEAINLMLLANVDSCPKVDEVVDVVGFVGQRPKLLNQLRFDEWFDVGRQPRKAYDGDVIL